MRQSRMIAWAAAGLLLSTSLAACARPEPAPALPPEPQVIVREVRETPPAELVRCPAAVAGLPTTGEAVIPPEWRAAIVRMARALSARTDQLNRLIQWHGGEACS